MPLAKVLTRLLLWSRLSSMVFWLVRQNMIQGINDFHAILFRWHDNLRATDLLIKAPIAYLSLLRHRGKCCIKMYRYFDQQP